MTPEKIPVQILFKIWETPGACRLTLKVPKDFRAIPGQYVTLGVADKSGIVHRRQYSITHFGSGTLSICVKGVPGGLVSNVLCDDCNPGDFVTLEGPEGDFILVERQLRDSKNLVFVTGGSGITPVYAIIRAAIEQEYTGKIYLVYGSVSESEIIFYEALKSLKTPNCEFIFAIDEDTPNWAGETGQLTEDKISEIFDKYHIPYQNTSFFTSGPYRVIENVKSHLESKRVKDSDIHSETFFVVANTEDLPTESHIVELIANNKKEIITVSPGTTILDAALQAGIPIAHRCKNGGCKTCVGRLTAGEIYTPMKRDSDSTEILTCQSYPLDDSVQINLNQSRTRKLLSNRNLAIAASMVLAFFLFQFFSAPAAAEYLAKGPLNTGHETLECASCHKPAPGNTRQQLQFNTRAFLGFTDSDYTDFGNLPVASENCLECHNRPNDRHPTHRFMEPRFAEAREAIHPESCISCHQEHHGQRITITPLDYCMNCHRDIEIKDDPLETSHASLIEQEQWNTCLQCHDFHGNHVFEVPDQIRDTIPLQAIKDYAAGKSDPYSELKVYIADSILKTR